MTKPTNPAPRDTAASYGAAIFIPAEERTVELCGLTRDDPSDAAGEALDRAFTANGVRDLAPGEHLTITLTRLT